MAAASAAVPAADSGVIETETITKVRHPDGSKAINGFRVREELGSGSFAKVKLCEEESSAEKFALKVFRKGRLRRQRDFISQEGGGMKIRSALDKVYNEIQIMKRIRSPNCIRLYAVFDEPDIDGKLYLVLEYAAGGVCMEWDGDRCTYYVPETKGLVPEPTAKSYVYDILIGLSHVHSVMVAHRDIKPQNLLVDADGNVKIGDFGVSILMGEDYKVHGTEGTYYFYAPETCRSDYAGHDGRRADVWAVGVSLWAFLYGTLPFFADHLPRLLESIAEGKYELPAMPSFSNECSSFLCKMLRPDAAQRPLPLALLEESWCPKLRKCRSPIPQ